MKTLKIYNTLSAQIANESGEYATTAEEYANELFETLEQDDTDLAEYADEYHGSTYYKKLHKITMTAEWVDEEADEYYESEWEERNDVYISFWQGKGFRIMTEAEFKA